jgi:uncharacterized membrane protein YiaA
MQEQIDRKLKDDNKESKNSFSQESIDGYFLGLIAIGLLSIIVFKNDITIDLKQGLFFVFLFLIFGAMDLFKSASKKSSQNSENN